MSNNPLYLKSIGKTPGGNPLYLACSRQLVPIATLL